jgi:deoxyribose-phosphate aldolase
MESDINIASYIDHTLLKPNATALQLKQLCDEAKTHQFASVCVNPSAVGYCSDLLKNSNIPVCTVIGFPLGANTKATKAFETKNAVENGATELDMVINIGALKDGLFDYVESDIRVVVEASKGNLVKVIIETCLLNKDEIVMACKLSKKAGAQFVKTSTGFSTSGATEEDIKLMRNTVGEKMGVKASGGIKNREDVLKMINAGATRIGASAGVTIINQ